MWVQGVSLLFSPPPPPMCSDHLLFRLCVPLNSTYKYVPVLDGAFVYFDAVHSDSSGVVWDGGDGEMVGVVRW